MEKKKNTENVTLENASQNSLVSTEGFISEAIKSNVPAETLEKLFSLYERVKAEHAREAFVQAMSNFQGQCPVIKKIKSVLNKDGTTLRYKYAPIDAVIEQIRKPLSENGLSYTWNVVRSQNHMQVTCTLFHKLGHSMVSTFEIPIIESQFMTSPQSYATAQTYAKRYTLLNVLGIGTADEDTDATDTGKDKVAKSEKARIIHLLKALNQPTTTKELIQAVVQQLTQLELRESNFKEIIGRLEMIISQNHEDREIQ